MKFTGFPPSLPRVQESHFYVSSTVNSLLSKCELYTPWVVCNTRLPLGPQFTFTILSRMCSEPGIEFERKTHGQNTMYPKATCQFFWIIHIAGRITLSFLNRKV